MVQNRHFLSCVTLKFDGCPWKTIGHLFYATLSFVFQSLRWIQTGVTARKRPILGQHWRFFSSLWFWNFMDNLEKIGHLFTTLSFVHHFKAIGEFKLELQSGNAQFGSKSAIFLSPVALKFDGWPWKTIGHLFCTTLSFVYYFKAIGEFKLELQSGNTQFRSQLAIFCPAWPWNLTDDLEKILGTSSMLLQSLCIIS